jgi:hypothetical protein
VQEHAGEEEDEEPEDFGDGYFAPYQKVSDTDLLYSICTERTKQKYGI